MAGRDADQVKKFFLDVGDVYITVEAVKRENWHVPRQGIKSKGWMAVSGL